MTNCSECNAPLPADATKNQMRCDACRKDRRDLFYCYSELRFDFWNYLHNNGLEKAKQFYQLMCDEEGDIDWVKDALGKEILSALGVL